MKKITDFKVIENKQLNQDTFVLQLQSNEKLEQILPGQFVECRIDNNPNVMLRRPLSIHNVDTDKNIIELFIKIVGNGTKELQKSKYGDTLNVIYPLGNSFSIHKNKKVLLAGGGCGVAPLLYLARELKENNCEVDILMGAKTKADILEIERYEALGRVDGTTEDGSYGKKGMIISHDWLQDSIKKYDYIYTCGPNIMMKHIAAIAEKNNIPCEVSLENTMACGIGACLCCVTNTTDGHKCVCTDGPVFDSKTIKW